MKIISESNKEQNERVPIRKKQGTKKYCQKSK